MAWGEEPCFPSAEIDRPNPDTFAQQRDTKYRTKTESARVLADDRRKRGIRLSVCDVKDLGGLYECAHGPNKRDGELADDPAARNRAVMGDKEYSIAFSAEDGHIFCL